MHRASCNTQRFNEFLFYYPPSGSKSVFEFDKRSILHSCLKHERKSSHIIIIIFLIIFCPFFYHRKYSLTDHPWWLNRVQNSGVRVDLFRAIFFLQAGWQRWRHKRGEEMLRFELINTALLFRRRPDVSYDTPPACQSILSSRSTFSFLPLYLHFFR